MPATARPVLLVLCLPLLAAWSPTAIALRGPAAVRRAGSAARAHTFGVPAGAAGTPFSAAFLAATAPLYEPCMGVENMAGALYALMRFVKPTSVVEIGAGYTSAWMLAALRDNEAELQAYEAAEAAADGPVRVFGEQWLEPLAEARQPGVLHVVDNLQHQSTSATKIEEVRRLALGGAARPRHPARSPRLRSPSLRDRPRHPARSPPSPPPPLRARSSPAASASSRTCGCTSASTRTSSTRRPSPRSPTAARSTCCGATSGPGRASSSSSRRGGRTSSRARSWPCTRR